MAGRSGAAAIEMELRDAATNFIEFLPTLVRQLQSSDAALAESLAACITNRTPTRDRREDELLLWFVPTPPDAAALRKTDVSDEFGVIAYGVEIMRSDDGTVVGASIYLQ